MKDDTKLFHQALRELLPGKHTGDLTRVELSEVLHRAQALKDKPRTHYEAPHRRSLGAEVP